MHLYCRKCNQKLTPMELQQEFASKANLKAEATLIPPGFFVKASEVDIHFDQPIDFLVNKESVSLNNHKDTSRFSGCCGPGNLGVLNQVCPNCNAEIGVIVEDCIFPYFIGISEHTVSKIPLW